MQALKFGEETLNQKNDRRYVPQKMYKKSSNIGMPGGGGKQGFPYNYEFKGTLPQASRKTHVEADTQSRIVRQKLIWLFAMSLTVCAISQAGNV